MGKKKKREEVTATAPKPFCYYCDKEFEDERVLICHQLAKHFRCQECVGNFRGRCETLAGLQIHMVKVHNRQITEVPNSIPGRSDLGIEVYGCRGIPDDLLRERNAEAVLNICSDKDSAALIPQLPSKKTILLASEVAPTALKEDVEQWVAMKQQEEEEELAKMPPPPQPPPFQLKDPGQSAGGGAPQQMSQMPLVPSMSQLQQHFGDLGGQPPFQASGFQSTDVVNALAGAAEMARLASAAFAVAPSGTLPQSSPAHCPGPQRSQKVGEAFDPNKEDNTAGLLPASGRQILIKPPMSNLKEGQQPRTSPQRSRSRGRRSRSREAETMESRTIHIVDGGHTASRIWLKKEMEKFGRVEVCHTGNKQNLKAEPPWVRFSSKNGADVALKAITNGQVFLDGKPLKAERRKEKPRPPATSHKYARSERDMEITSRELRHSDRRRPTARNERDMEMTSRDLAMQDRRRDRSTSNRRRRSRSQSDRRRRR